jgi:hypothetical protein
MNRDFLLMTNVTSSYDERCNYRLGRCSRREGIHREWAELQGPRISVEDAHSPRGTAPKSTAAVAG